MVMMGHSLMTMLAVGNRRRRRKILNMHFHHEGVTSRWSWRIICALVVLQFRRMTFPSRFIVAEAKESLNC